MSTINATDHVGSKKILLGTLAGAGYSDILECNNSKGFKAGFLVSGIGTNVVVNLLGGFDDTNMEKLTSDLTITANGQYHIINPYNFPYYKLEFVSSSGGSPSVICTGNLERIS